MKKIMVLFLSFIMALVLFACTTITLENIAISIGFTNSSDQINGVTSDLVLPTKLEGGYTITWQSSHEKVISTVGVVVRQDEDVIIVLTPTVTKKEKSLTRSPFNITVLAKTQGINIVITFTKEGDTLDKVTGDLILPTELAGNIKITWESSNFIVISNHGTVVIPENDTNVTLTPKVTRDGKQIVVAPFIVTVLGKSKPLPTNPSLADLHLQYSFDLTKEVSEYVNIESPFPLYNMINETDIDGTRLRALINKEEKAMVFSALSQSKLNKEAYFSFKSQVMMQGFELSIAFWRELDIDQITEFKFQVKQDDRWETKHDFLQYKIPIRADGATKFVIRESTKEFRIYLKGDSAESVVGNSGRALIKDFKIYGTETAPLPELAPSEVFNNMILDFNEGDSQNHVIRDVALPTEYKRATIDWSVATNPYVVIEKDVLTALRVNKRPPIDTEITLVVVITIDGTPTSFNYVINLIAPFDLDVILQNISIGYSGSDTSELVTQSVLLITFYQENNDYFLIEWTSSHPEYMSDSGYIVEFPTTKTQITLTAKIYEFDTPEIFKTRDYLIILDQQKTLDEISQMISFNFKPGDSLDSLTGHIGIPISIIDVIITWSVPLESSSFLQINHNDETIQVFRPQYLENNHTSKLTATLTRNSETLAIDFPVIVLAEEFVTENYTYSFDFTTMPVHAYDNVGENKALINQADGKTVLVNYKNFNPNLNNKATIRNGYVEINNLKIFREISISLYKYNTSSNPTKYTVEIFEGDKWIEVLNVFNQIDTNANKRFLASGFAATGIRITAQGTSNNAGRVAVGLLDLFSNRQK